MNISATSEEPTSGKPRSVYLTPHQQESYKMAPQPPTSSGQTSMGPPPPPPPATTSNNVTFVLLNQTPSHTNPHRPPPTGTNPHHHPPAPPPQPLSKLMFSQMRTLSDNFYVSHIRPRKQMIIMASSYLPPLPRSPPARLGRVRKCHVYGLLLKRGQRRLPRPMPYIRSGCDQHRVAKRREPLVRLRLRT